MNYAGFLRRWTAATIDGLIILLVGALIVGIGVAAVVLIGFQTTAGPVFSIITGVVSLLLSLGPLVYETVMIARTGATYGKGLRRLRVVRTNGEPVSGGRALARTLAKSFLSSILFIGFFIALFTAKKQSLHDLLADTVVVRVG